jgi:hypothetical protein
MCCKLSPDLSVVAGTVEILRNIYSWCTDVFLHMFNCPLMPIARGQPEEGGGDPAQVEEGVGPLAADFFVFVVV